MFLHVSVILSTISGGRRNTYGWQAGGTHPTGMLSCCTKFLLLVNINESVSVPSEIGTRIKTT